MVSRKGVVIDFGAVQKRLSWDTALVEADSSEGFPLEKDNLKTCRSGSFSGHVTTRATAYYR